MLEEERKGPFTADKQTTAQTILVVEDDVAIQEFLANAFSSYTVYRYQIAKNASQAVNFARRVKPDLFVLDILLPDMNGLELYDLLHATPGFETIPAIIITAVNLEKFRLAIEKCEVTVIKKPFDLDMFLHTVQQLLGDPSN